MCEVARSAVICPQGPASDLRLLWSGLLGKVKMAHSTAYTCLAVAACLLVACNAADKQHHHPHHHKPCDPTSSCPLCGGSDRAPPPGDFEYFVLQKCVHGFYEALHVLYRQITAGLILPCQAELEEIMQHAGFPAATSTDSGRNYATPVSRTSRTLVRTRNSM